MRAAFHPRLINGPFEDPGLYIPFQFLHRALLFDLGDLSGLSNRELLKISHVFVSHTHMDHFIGFDRLLRIALGRDTMLHFFGPEGFTDNVAGKLSGYTWNLVSDDTHPLEIMVTEVGSTRMKTSRFLCRKRFERDPDGIENPFDGRLLIEPAFSVRTALFDHRVPCLGFSLDEQFHINIDTAQLDRLGLPTGPWLSDFKNAVYKANPESYEIVIPGANGAERKPYRLGELTQAIARITPGQTITYITDVGYNEQNVQRIVELARGADHLFIEAAFRDDDAHIAHRKHHLTARQAGSIARQAGVRRLTIFHFSPRYQGMEEQLEAEAQAAFEGR